MASVFKRGGKWMASFKGADGLWKSRVAGTDKGEAMRLTGLWGHEAQLRREGLVDPKADTYAKAESKSAAGHVADFEADLVARGGTAGHCHRTARRVRMMLDLGAVVKLSDLSPERINAAAKRLRDGSGDRPAMSKASVCHYLRAVKGFSRWLWRNGKARDDALTGVKVGTVQKSERVKVRRAMSREEFAALVATVGKAGASFGMAGAERAMLYTLAVGTGLRISEIASLTPESFALNADGGPVVALRAAYSKRRRDDRQPINADLAAALAGWLGGKAAKVAAFKLPAMENVAEMIHRDLRLARARWIRAVGSGKGRRERRESDFLAVVNKGGARLDFHALRHTYITWIVAGGAPVSVAQSLARHSSPMLTLGIYSHVTLSDESRALAALPPVGAPASEPQGRVLIA